MTGVLAWVLIVLLAATGVLKAGKWWWRSKYEGWESQR